MRKIMFFSFSMAVLCLAVQAQGKVVRGKVIYRSCATIAIQVLDKAYLKLGQPNWRQAKSKPVYKHVFAAANTCSFPPMKTGTPFRFKVVKAGAADNDCNTCMLFDNPPAKKLMITVLAEGR